MTIQEAKERLLFQLFHNYDDREAASIADWVLEKLTGWKKIDRVINKKVPLNTAQQEQLENYIIELANHRPVQYVLGEAWFQGMCFYVNESTLIPRPETEELVEWLIEDYKKSGRPEQQTIVDIGTGSGCIPISIKKKLPSVRMISCDVSVAAINVATINAESLQTEVEFLEKNILDESGWESFPVCDTLISNPPYIPQQDRQSLALHVVDHEPALALFVPDNNALLFYDSIAKFGKEKLKAGGSIYFEINEQLAPDVQALLEGLGYTEVVVRKDMQGKERMIRCTKG